MKLIAGSVRFGIQNYPTNSMLCIKFPLDRSHRFLEMILANNAMVYQRIHDMRCKLFTLEQSRNIQLVLIHRKLPQSPLHHSICKLHQGLNFILVTVVTPGTFTSIVAMVPGLLVITVRSPARPSVSRQR